MSSESLPQLANPPIVEAVVDLDCIFDQAPDLQGIRLAAAEAVGQDYPESDQVWRTDFRVDISKAGANVGASQVAPECQALRFWNKQRNQLVQFRTAGFSFNRLRPYSGFDAYKEELRANWLKYCDIAAPNRINIVRLRYVNVIRIEQNLHDIDDYFKIGPRIPTIEPELSVARFSNKCLVFDSARSSDAEIALDLRPANDSSRYTLTITVGKRVDIEPIDWLQVCSTIESLRGFKNILFKESITEKCLQLFG